MTTVHYPRQLGQLLLQLLLSNSLADGPLRRVRIYSQRAWMASLDPSLLRAIMSSLEVVMEPMDPRRPGVAFRV